MSQLHKNFTTEQVIELLQRYINKEIERQHIQKIFSIKKAMFFRILQKYRKDPKSFSIKYLRKSPKRISNETEKIIIKELKIDKQIIKDKKNPTQWYNYSYIKDRLEDKYKQKVSLPTIIDRAKKNDFYLQKKSKKKAHDREVLTDYVGELIQHDASIHLWAPDAGVKWTLISGQFCSPDFLNKSE